MYYMGLDVHLRTSTIHIVNHWGKDVKTHTIKGHWTDVVEWLKKFWRPFTICYEASCGYGPLHDAIQKIPNAKRVVVAHPGNLRLIFRTKRKNDRVDAQKLAKLLYLGEVPEIHGPSVEVRNWRLLVEFRRKEIEKRTRVKNNIRGLFRVQGVRVPHAVRHLWTQKGRRWLGEFRFDDAHAQFQLDILLMQLDQAVESVQRVTDRLDAIGAKHPGVRLLMTIPGVGPRTAEAVLAYVDDPSRFKRISRIGSYFGLVPSQNASGETNRLGQITKHGPATVRKYMVEAAWQAVRRCEPVKDYYERVMAGKAERKRVALIAVAHKLLRCMLAMLRTGEEWSPTRVAA